MVSLMRSLETLAAAQSSRLRSAPKRTEESSPTREPALEAIRQRNAFLDYIFYDLANLATHEAKILGPESAAEGAVLRVGPSGSSQLEVWGSAEDFIETNPTEFGAIAVSGVGSSALGSAAFARNVADAIEKPVIAVVSGYGLSDLFTEALGGFFWFGQVNSIRNLFEPIDQLLQPTLSAVGGSSDETTLSATVSALRKSLDVKTLVTLLATETSCELLIGHSKGNLVISEALFALREFDSARLADLGRDTKVITVSARVAMPRQFKNVIDVMGSLDAFGEFNSRRQIANDIVVSGAWHHTNTELPMHLPVTRTVGEALGKPT